MRPFTTKDRPPAIDAPNARLVVDKGARPVHGHSRSLISSDIPICSRCSRSAVSRMAGQVLSRSMDETAGKVRSAPHKRQVEGQVEIGRAHV